MGTELRKVDNLRYVLLPGRLLDASPQQRAFHDAAFTFWRTFWSEVYKSVGESGAIDGADFYRQDVVAVLVHGEQIVALQSYTRFDVRSLAARNHSYFDRHFHQLALKALEDRGLTSLMTMEYGSVIPDWRASQTGISLAAILVGLSMRIASALGVDGTITSARADNNSDKLAKAFGGETISRVTVHQRATELLVFDPARIHPHESNDVNQAIERLWATRFDETALTTERRQDKKAA